MPPIFRLAITFGLMLALAASRPPRTIQHVTFTKCRADLEDGLPITAIWSWRNEILVGFSAAYFQLKSPDRHPYDTPGLKCRRLPAAPMAGRPGPSRSHFQSSSAITGRKTSERSPSRWISRTRTFVMKLWFDDANKGPSYLWYSKDRGHNWRGPFAVPDFGQPAVAARTDYIVNGKHDAFLFLTAAKKNGKEGRVFCARTVDGGLHWTFVSWIGEEPAGFSIMPSSVRISPDRNPDRHSRESRTRPRVASICLRRRTTRSRGRCVPM